MPGLLAPMLRTCANCAAAAGVLMLATISMCVQSAAADAGLTPCSRRYTVAATFPPASEPAAASGTHLRQLLGNKGWGLAEDVSLQAMDGAPSPLVMAVKIPLGAIDHKNPTAPMGGMGFRWRPGMQPATTAACLTYSLLLPADFQFNKGGKLPGLFGGDGPAGGKDVDGSTGFSARFMWRSGGQGEVYAYIPGKPDGRGQSIDRGAWVFPRGTWVRMDEEVVLNTPGAADGRLRVWVNGELKLRHDDIVFRTSPDLGIDGVMADIFYGGKTQEWAAPADTVIRLTPFALAWR